MPFTLDPATLLRASAWALALGIGLAAGARRSGAAGRAMAFLAVVWAGGVQLLLTLQAAAQDAATQQLLYRVSYYAVLFTSSAVLALLLYAPRHAARPWPALAALLVVPVLASLVFAGDHQAFVAEAVGPDGYAVDNSGLMHLGFPVAVWTGFLAAMLWLGARAPSLDGAAQASAVWLMAGLGLFAGDRFARTATAWVRDPASLGPGVEGAVYGLFMLSFGVGVAWMLLRARGLPGPSVLLAAMAGLAVGATTIATYDAQLPDWGLRGGLAVGVLLSALLGPAYVALLARGARRAPAQAVVLAANGRAAVMAET